MKFWNYATGEPWAIDEPVLNNLLSIVTRDHKSPDETIEAIADSALDKDTGARGLRAILEQAMMDVMFEVPSKKSVEECVITPGVIRNSEEPLLVYDKEVSGENDVTDSSVSA